MSWFDVISIVVSSGVLTSVITHLLTRRKFKVETDGAENDVLINEINFLSQRQELLQTQLTEAMARELDKMKKIAELNETIARLTAEINQLKTNHTVQ